MHTSYACPHMHAIPLQHHSVFFPIAFDSDISQPCEQHSLQERPLVAWLVATRNEAHAAIPDRRREFGHAIKSE